MGAIHVAGVEAAATLGAAVAEVLAEMRDRAARVGKPGGLSMEQFQTYMMYAAASLDALKKMGDIVEQSARAFHRA